MRLSLTRLSLALVFCSGLSAPISAAEKTKLEPRRELSGVKDTGLAAFIADASLLSEKIETYESGSPSYWVNIFSVREYRKNACAPLPCPLERIYLVLSVNAGEGDVIKAYHASEWKFLNWDIVPRYHVREDRPVVFKVEGHNVIMPDGSIVKSGKFEIGIRQGGGYIVQVKN